MAGVGVVKVSLRKSLDALDSWQLDRREPWIWVVDMFSFAIAQINIIQRISLNWSIQMVTEFDGMPRGSMYG